MDFLIDTHILSWSLTDNPRLNQDVRKAIEEADKVVASCATVYEIGQKVRLGKWEAMAPIMPEIGRLASEFGCGFEAIDVKIATIAAGLDWAHRDPFDRIIAATSIVTGYRLVSGDAAFATLDDARFMTPFW